MSDDKSRIVILGGAVTPEIIAALTVDYEVETSLRYHQYDPTLEDLERDAQKYKNNEIHRIERYSNKMKNRNNPFKSKRR